MSDVFILAAKRTPIGSFQGALSTVPAPRLGSVAIAAALESAQVDPASIEEVLMGNVVSAGIGQNPARQASIGAGIPYTAGAVTISKVCGSGLKAAMIGRQAIRLGDAQLVVAGGMENMSLAPYLLPQARSGYRMGDGRLIDAMIQDGLWDCYGGRHMGVYGDQCASKFAFSREAQDDFAVRSYQRAQQAVAEGWFVAEIAPVEVTSRKETITVDQDEEPARFDEAKLRKLRPAFDEAGTITAGNASTINDGGAALVLASASAQQQLDVEPLGRIVGDATFSCEPEWFTTAPIGALKKLLAKLNWTVDDVDLFEINEAFSVVTMAAEHDLQIPAEKVNIHGGAVALGHPIGCSGARILVTLLHALQRTRTRRGIACLCIGGGEAVAVAVER